MGIDAPPLPARRPTDRVSLWALVSALCCLAPVGLVLGVMGLRRTRSGDVFGRPYALLAVTISLIAFATAPAGWIASRWLADSMPRASDVSAGDCFDLDDERTIDLTDCSEPHHAEVAGTGRVDDELAARYDEASAATLCAPFLSATHARAAGTGRYAIGLLVDTSQADEPTTGDDLVCYLAELSGRDLLSPVRAP